MSSKRFFKSTTLLTLVVLIAGCHAANYNNVILSNNESSPKATTTAEYGQSASASGWLSPEYQWFFEFPLPIPPVKQSKL
jgi:bilirubin oxidase